MVFIQVSSQLSKDTYERDRESERERALLYITLLKMFTTHMMYIYTHTHGLEPSKEHQRTLQSPSCYSKCVTYAISLYVTDAQDILMTIHITVGGIQLPKEHQGHHHATQGRHTSLRLVLSNMFVLLAMECVL